MTLMTRLTALVGEGRCGSPVLLQPASVDGFAMRAFSPNSPAGVVESRAGG